jgi:hypothetical protein
LLARASPDPEGHTRIVVAGTPRDLGRHGIRVHRHGWLAILEPCNSSPSVSSPIEFPATYRCLFMSDSPCVSQSADIDERAIRREEPEQLVKALAEAKVRTGNWTVIFQLGGMQE